MALADNLTAEKASLIALLESEYTQQNLRDQLLERLYYVRFLLGELGGGGGGSTAIEGTANGYPVAVSAAQISYTESNLTTAGTATTSRSKVGYPAISISYTVALNGSTSVTMRCQVSNDGTNWLNANLAGTDTTHTVNGTYGFVGTNQYQFVRLLKVSEAGGTGAVISAISLTLGQY